MNFFTKSLSNIEFQDIVGLVTNKNRESVFLDYKSCPNIKSIGGDEVAKDVSAFANSEGGWLIYGVKTDQSDIYPVEIEGLNDPHGLQDKIVQACSDPTNLNPPIFVDPQILTGKYQGSDRSVVVVKIDRSTNTPHFIKDSTNFYIRVADKARPMNGNPAILALLQNRRQKMQEVKDTALQESQEMAVHHLLKETKRERTEGRYPCSFLHLSVIPEIFGHNFFNIEEIGRMIESVNRGFYSKFGTQDRFYKFFGEPIETISSGIVYRWGRYPFLDDTAEPNVLFDQLNSTGLLSHFEDMSFRYNAPDEKGVERKQYAIIPFDILRTMIGFLSFVSDLFLIKDINITLNFKAELFQVRDMLIMRYDRPIRGRWVVENHFVIKHNITMNKEFANKVQDFVLGLVSNDLLRGVNYTYNEHLALDEINYIMTPFKK